MRDIKIKNLLNLLDTDYDKKGAKEIIKDRVDQIGELCDKLYAHGKYSVLIVLQGMDASGKDGAMRNVFKEIPPYVITTTSFKKPTKEEFGHDFLWRVHEHAPSRGEVVVMNRSHYEDILIQHVHGWIDDDKRDQRMKHINNFENLLVEENNTIILKFFLNISYEQQELELQERIDEREKNWKHKDGDWEERKHWNKYMEAYEYVLNNSVIPWFPIPVDKRYHRDLAMTEIILDKLNSLDLEWPELESEL